jgi:hypothetical protein
MKRFLIIFLVVSIFFSGCSISNTSSNETSSYDIESFHYPNTDIIIDATDYSLLVPEEIFSQSNNSDLKETAYQLFGSVEDIIDLNGVPCLYLDTLNGKALVANIFSLVEEGDELAKIDYEKLESYFPMPEKGDYIFIVCEYSGYNEALQCPTFFYATKDYLTTAILRSTIEYDFSTSSQENEQITVDNQNHVEDTLYTFYGSGDDVISNISLDKNVLYFIHIEYLGTSVFSLSSIGKDGKKELLKSAYGTYCGDIFLDNGSPFSLEISANGDWRLTIEPISQSDSQYLKGTGDFVSGILEGPSGVWEITYDGDGVFSVFLVNGTKTEYILSNYGKYSGKKYISFPDGGAAFEVTADGDWSIKTAQ